MYFSFSPFTCNPITIKGDICEATCIRGFPAHIKLISDGFTEYCVREVRVQMAQCSGLLSTVNAAVPFEVQLGCLIVGISDCRKSFLIYCSRS